jgi:hypothetical protein
MHDTQEKPDVSEQYSSAINASNLRVEAERRSQADILMAASWSQSRLGGALLRLHSEWDACEHPRRPTPENVEAIANSLKKEPHELTLTKRELSPAQRKEVANHDRRDAARRMIEAAATADRWYRHEMALLMGKLKTLPEVRHQLNMQASKWNVPEAESVVSLVLIWWFSKICPACNGVKFQVIPGTPTLSAKLCKRCHGTGESQFPSSSDARKLANHIEMCTNAARQSIRRRLHP